MFCFLICTILSVLIYFKLLKPCRYWKEKGIKYEGSWPLVGSVGKAVFRKQPIVDVAVNIYNKYPEERYVGYMQYTQKRLLVRDLELIKQVTVKDFNHFTDRVVGSVQSKSLVSLNGDEWKNVRAALTPAFTSSKMRNMYLLIEECVQKFVDNLEEEVELEARDAFSRVVCNVIASTAFGVKIDCVKDSENEFYRKGHLLLNFTCWKKILGVVPKINAFFRNIIKDNIQKRENEGFVRPDLIHILLEARKGQLKTETIKSEKNEGFAAAELEIDPTAQKIELTDEDILAQAVLFFLSGFDTVTTSSSFMAHEVAVNPDVQKRLQEEIDKVRNKHGNKIPYEAILGMKYLDQVVSETLRLWPVTTETDRLCVKDYTIPSEDPEEKGFLIEKGIDVVVPIMAIHRDSRYYVEPDRFDPERFNDENRSKVVPGTYMPFGCGPRNCIGSRFALLEVKTLFFHLLSKFDIVPVARTEIPIRLQPKSGFWLGLKPRKRSSD